MEAIEVIELIARGEDSRAQFKRNIHSAESQRLLQGAGLVHADEAPVVGR